jgi:hypothetical protein
VKLTTHLKNANSHISTAPIRLRGVVLSTVYDLIEWQLSTVDNFFFTCQFDKFFDTCVTRVV